MNNELSELEGLADSTMMGDEAAAQKEYVEPEKHDMRRSR